MALSIFKSPDEEPWDRFCNRMERALAAASGEFRRRHDRQIALGSPVKLAEAGEDVIRAPIEVRGGPREYSVAYLHVKNVEGRLDERRLASIAQEAVRAAEPYAEAPPEKPGQTVLTYP